MGRDWMAETRRDHFYRQAKRSGYRARSAYKLKEINKKFRLFGRGDRVLDIGAAPGGWTQVAVEAVGPGGLVVGVDLQPMEPLEGALLVRGDITRDEILAYVEGKIGSADCVISDISPELSGNYSMDQARSVHLSTMALRAALRVLRGGGRFVTKVFEGEDLDELLFPVRDNFRTLRRFHPRASRQSSSELYVIGKGFSGAGRK